MRKLTLLYVILAFGSGLQGQDLISNLSGDLMKGKYGVGFSSKWIIDETRPYQKSDLIGLKSLGRPLRLMMWYPSKLAEDNLMLFGEYFRELTPENNQFNGISGIVEAKEADTMRRQFSNDSKDSLVSVIETFQTMAIGEADPMDGSFPLIIHSLGQNDFQQESTVMWEYLASHGHVVVVMPQMGLSLTEMSAKFSVEVVEAHKEDISYALDYLKSSDLWTRKIDFGAIGLLGHSAGGTVSLAFANENKTSSIVLLDGAIHDDLSQSILKKLKLNYGHFVFEMLNLFPSYRVGMTNLPLFDSLEGANVHHVEIPKATYFDFQQWPVYSFITGVSDSRGESYRSAKMGAAIYYSVCELVLHFFNYSLKDIGEEEAFVNGTKALQYPEKIDLVID